MSSCSLSYLGGVFDCAATISCGSDAVMDPVTGWIIKSNDLPKLDFQQQGSGYQLHLHYLLAERKIASSTKNLERAIIAVQLFLFTASIFFLNTVSF
jgi:hypothetical protein